MRILTERSRGAETIFAEGSGVYRGPEEQGRFRFQLTANSQGHMRLVAYRTIGPTFLDTSWDGTTGIAYAPTYAGRKGSAWRGDTPPPGWAGALPSLLWGRESGARLVSEEPGEWVVERPAGEGVIRTIYATDRLVPRTESLIRDEETLRIIYGGADFVRDARTGFVWPIRLRLEDAARSETVTLTISRVRLNPRVKPARFRTTLPPGVEPDGALR